MNLFDENFRYTPTAINIDREFRRCCLDIFNKWAAVGCSPRDIALIGMHVLVEQEMDQVLAIGWDRPPKG